MYVKFPYSNSGLISEQMIVRMRILKGRKAHRGVLVLSKEIHGEMRILCEQASAVLLDG